MTWPPAEDVSAARPAVHHDERAIARGARLSIPDSTTRDLHEAFHLTTKTWFLVTIYEPM
jgi:hypothetical protein